MTRDASMEGAMTVVSVSTGTKCVNGEHMSISGLNLNGEINVLHKWLVTLRNGKRTVHGHRFFIYFLKKLLVRSSFTFYRTVHYIRL